MTVDIELGTQTVGPRTGAKTLRGAFRALSQGSGSGQINTLPVLVGLVVVSVLFQLLNSAFLTADNLTNLALECAATGTISIGVVIVLLVAQIDLSVGSLSGFAPAIFAVGFVLHSWPLWLALVIAIAAAAAIGLIYGLIHTLFGIPSFIITMAGLMAVLGLQLLVLGSNVSVNIPFESWFVGFAQRAFLPPWLSYALILLAVAFQAAATLLSSRRRKKAGVDSQLVKWTIIKGSVLLVLLEAFAWYLNTSRGIGVMFVLFFVLVVIMDYALSHTSWGRCVYAVGGNAEAARRAGIPVNRVLISAFVLGAIFAAIGGLLATARLASAGISSGAGDTNLVAIAAAVIGGTSLFGGRGSTWSALLGIVVIQAIANGLTLLSLESSIQYLVTGGVLLLAVIVDAVSRRSRIQHAHA